MKSISVTAERNYTVSIGVQWEASLIELVRNRTRVGVIVSSGFSPDLKLIQELDCEVHVFTVPDGEEGKSTTTLFTLWNWLGAAGFTRSDVIVGIGGGAITDLAGFAAATWLRGIDWIAVPTSLVGMVDASVGGKTGINSDYGKNLIGAFHSPISVIVDIDFLFTLSVRDLSAGMAEVIKCGFISDPEILNLSAKCSAQNLLTNQAVLEDLIYRAVAVKASVVSIDFKESYAREALPAADGARRGPRRERVGERELPRHAAPAARPCGRPLCGAQRREAPAGLRGARRARPAAHGGGSGGGQRGGLALELVCKARLGPIRAHEPEGASKQRSLACVAHTE
jgi:hypothetical protein